MAPTNAELDERILFFARPQWLKVARVLGYVMFEYEGKGIEVSDHSLDARLQALINQGFLESAGDVSKWRHSEIRKLK